MITSSLRSKKVPGVLTALKNLNREIDIGGLISTVNRMKARIGLEDTKTVLSNCLIPKDSVSLFLGPEHYLLFMNLKGKVYYFSTAVFYNFYDSLDVLKVYKHLAEEGASGCIVYNFNDYKDRSETPSRDKSTINFKEVMERNKQNQERIKEERKKNNNSVARYLK